MPANWSDFIGDKKITSKLDKLEKKRQETIYELIQTEKGYMRHLEIINQLFRQPIIDEKLVMSNDQLSGLFANLDKLIELSKPLCQKLTELQQAHTDKVGRSELSNRRGKEETKREREKERKGGDEDAISLSSFLLFSFFSFLFVRHLIIIFIAFQIVEHVAQAFLEGFNHIDPQAYAVFCANQKHASALYQEKKKSSPTFASCIKYCESHPMVERLSFLDYLAKPLQVTTMTLKKKKERKKKKKKRRRRRKRKNKEGRTKGRKNEGKRKKERKKERKHRWKNVLILS